MLKITIKNQSLGLSEEVVAENSAEFAAFSASFSSEWDGYEKTVRFRHAEGGAVYDVAHVEDGKEYFIPAEVLHRGRVYVSCVGVKGTGSIATATRESFEVRGSLITGEGTVPTVTPNAYAQYVRLVKDRADEVKAWADRAEEYKDQAADSSASAASSSAAAVKSANAARSAENRAKDFASAAALSEASARASLDMVMNETMGLDEKCTEKKNELDLYAGLKKSDIDAYAEKTCLEVQDYADALKKDFSADAHMITTNFDVNYAYKSDLLSQKAEEGISQTGINAENAKKYAKEAEESAFSASVCKNQTLNALSSVLQSEQKASESAEGAALSSQIAAEKAAEAHNSALELASAKDTFYTRDEANKRFLSAFYSYKKGDGLYLGDADTDTEFESLTVYGNTLRSHIPTPYEPCEITSFDGNIVFCGENVLDPERCVYQNAFRENGKITVQAEEGDDCAIIRMDGYIPFLRAGETYTLTVKSDTAAEDEKTVVCLGNAEFYADAAAGFVTFTVPYTWDMSAFYVILSYFGDERDRAKRKRTYTCLGLNRGMSPVYTPYEGYTLSVGSRMNGITVYNGKNGNPASKICDTVEYRNGEIKLIQRIDKTVINGSSSENWTYIATREKPNTVGFICKIKGKGNYPVICDRFDYCGKTSEALTEQIASNGQINYILLQISKEAIGWTAERTSAENIAAVKEWMSRNNTTLYFVLDKPVERVISTNKLFPYKNIYCDFPGVIFEAEYKSERTKPYPCVISNTACGETVEMTAASEDMPIEKTEIFGKSVQANASPGAPKTIEGFGNAVISYKGSNLTNYNVYTAKNAVCTSGIVKVTLPAGEKHAVLYDETLNYSLEGGKTYNLCVECDRAPEEGERIGININGNAFYSEAGSRNVTFTVPVGVKERNVFIYLCSFAAPVSENKVRIYGAIRVTESEYPMPYEMYKGSLIFMGSEMETGLGTKNAVLRSCGDVRDRISVCAGVGIMEKNIATHTASGGENIEFLRDCDGGNTAEFVITLPDYRAGDIYCSHFNMLGEGDISLYDAEGVYGTEKGIVIRINTARLEGYDASVEESGKCGLLSVWLSANTPVFQYVLRNPQRYDISESNFCRSIMRLNTVGKNGHISSVFDTGFQTSSFGTVQGDISVTYPCDIAELMNFKIAEAIKIRP